MTTVDFKNTYWTYSGTCALFSKKERARLSGKLVSTTSNVSHCLYLPKNPKFYLSSFQIEWVLTRLPTVSLQSGIKYISQTWTKSDQPLEPLRNNHRPGKVSLVGETHSVPGDEKNAPQRRICDENALWMFDVTDLRITGILGSSLQQLDEFSLTLRFQVFPAEFVIQRIDIYVIEILD